MKTNWKTYDSFTPDEKEIALSLISYRELYDSCKWFRRNLAKEFPLSDERFNFAVGVLHRNRLHLGLYEYARVSADIEYVRQLTSAQKEAISAYILQYWMEEIEKIAKSEQPTAEEVNL